MRHNINWFKSVGSEIGRTGYYELGELSNESVGGVGGHVRYIKPEGFAFRRAVRKNEFSIKDSYVINGPATMKANLKALMGDKDYIVHGLLVDGMEINRLDLLAYLQGCAKDYIAKVYAGKDVDEYADEFISEQERIVDVYYDPKDGGSEPKKATTATTALAPLDIEF